MPNNTLRNTIILSFCLGSFLLTSLYGFFIFFGAKNLEDHFFSTQLENITQTYLERFHEGQEGVPALSLKSYIGTEKMDDDLFEAIGHYPNGSYEIQLDSRYKERELQFSITQIPESNKRLYIVYDVSGFEITHQQEKNFIVLLIIFGFIVCCVGCLIGYYLAIKVTKPITLLTQRIQKVTPESLNTDLVFDLPQNEFYSLGKALERAHKRINGFINRERDFTRNASHELRTPLTVIQGATDILKQSQTCMPRPLQRIQRSVHEMQLNIDTFLALAREEDQEESISLNDTCKKVINNLSFLVENKDVYLTLQEFTQRTVTCSPQLFEIMLSNLLRNSIRHTAHGEIKIIIDTSTITVQDTGSGITPEAISHVTKPGYADKISGQTGFGLTIVSKICARKNWKFTITSPGKAKGCMVEINLSS